MYERSIYPEKRVVPATIINIDINSSTYDMQNRTLRNTQSIRSNSECFIVQVVNNNFIVHSLRYASVSACIDVSYISVVDVVVVNLNTEYTSQHN